MSIKFEKPEFSSYREQLQFSHGENIWKPQIIILPKFKTKKYTWAAYRSHLGNPKINSKIIADEVPEVSKIHQNSIKKRVNLDLD